MSLLSRHDVSNDQKHVCETHTRGGSNHNCASVECRHSRLISTLLSDPSAMERAREVCLRHGLLQDAGLKSSDNFVGVMHQLVQRCIRHELVTTGAVGKVVVDATREALQARFSYTSETPPSQWPEMRRLVPCLEAWASRVCGKGETTAALDPADVPCVANSTCLSSADHDGMIGDALLLTRWGTLMSNDGDVRTTERAHTNALSLFRQVMPAGHPQIAFSMYHVATAYSDLGRHDAALTMSNEALDIFRATLLPDHPHIADTMRLIASEHYDLGRRDEALQMYENALAFYQRVLPSDDSRIASCMGSIARTYYALGQRTKALEIAEDVLALHRRVLPPDHPHIAVSMNNLATMLSDLGRNEDACEMLEDVLAFRQRLLLPNHPSIGTAMAELATVYTKIGRYGDALTMSDGALAIMRDALPPGHEDIVTSMSNLAYVYEAHPYF
jgi:tetratricopeptide (TPR) repeat protein